MPSTYPGIAEYNQWLDLYTSALSARNYGEFVEKILPGMCENIPISSAMIYLEDHRLQSPFYFQYGLDLENGYSKETFLKGLAELMAKPEYEKKGSQPGFPTGLVFYPLQHKQHSFGLLGLWFSAVAEFGWSNFTDQMVNMISITIYNLLAQIETIKQLEHLNTYLTVSSMLPQSLDLPELLEASLYCCMEVTHAEAASILLLDDEKKNFKFYQVEGPASPILETATFPADQGLAGSILLSQQSEVIKDAQSDPRFYGKVDSESGFLTRDMIAVPLTAGEEKIGVLEVLNKADVESFNEDERMLLVSIAEEIAYAIRNSRLFEYVVTTYCKQRQGLNSCRGCQRPLGSWTPCVKYRSANQAS